jgi:hypothetical protein
MQITIQQQNKVCRHMWHAFLDQIHGLYIVQ